MVEIQLLLLALCLSIGARLCASSCASVCVDKVSGVNRSHIHYHNKYENNLAIHDTEIVNRIAHMSPHNTSSYSAAKCKVLLTIDIEQLTLDIA